MGKFCGKCGAPIDPATGFCTQCDVQAVPPIRDKTGHNAAQGGVAGVSPSGYDMEKVRAEKVAKAAEERLRKKEEKKRAWSAAKKRYKDDIAAKRDVEKKYKKEKKAAKLAAMSKKQKAGRICLKILLVLLMVVLAVGFAYWGITSLYSLIGDKRPAESGATSYEGSSSVHETDESENTGGSIGKDNPPIDEMPDDYEVSKPDADEYFQNNAEIVSTQDAASAGRTEAEAYKNLADRGFTSMPITADYTMDGTYTGAKEIVDTATEKHPAYSTYYVSATGLVWNIFEINGAVFANPLSYNMELQTGVQVMFSETDTVTSYDSTLNKFYVTKPDETVLDVKTIGRIDAATLDTITAEGMGAL